MREVHALDLRVERKRLSGLRKAAVDATRMVAHGGDGQYDDGEQRADGGDDDEMLQEAGYASEDGQVQVAYVAAAG